MSRETGSYGLTIKPPGDEDGARFSYSDDSDLEKLGEAYVANWALELPHQSDQWMIAQGSREEVLEAAREFRAELDGAIAALESAKQEQAGEGER